LLVGLAAPLNTIAARARLVAKPQRLPAPRQLDSKRRHRSRGIRSLSVLTDFSPLAPFVWSRGRAAPSAGYPSTTGRAPEFLTWPRAKLDSIDAIPSSRVSLVFRKRS
jgi:hypothetical protein